MQPERNMIVHGLWTTLDLDAPRRQRERDAHVRVREAVALDAAPYHRHEVVALALGGAQTLLEARCLAHALQDRIEPPESLLGARDVELRLLRQRRQL